MLITIDLNSEIPIYIQLRNSIVHGISTGELKAGEILPSVRQLAGDLGINLHTVNKVYQLLKTEGFLTIHRQKGVVVNESREFIADNNYAEKLEEQLMPIITESFCRGVSSKDFYKICKKIYDEISYLRLKSSDYE